jgi:hypothetical protein
MKLICRALVLIFFLFSQGTGQSVKSQTDNVLPKLMSSDREIALAMSAGPPSVADKATIYVLRATGYVREREGTNGFTCLVVRDTPVDQAPVCHDPEGTRTVVPRLLAEASLRAEGKTSNEVRRQINEGLRTGKYRIPQRVGIAYMLSTENRGPLNGRIIRVPPHIMFYAPFLKMDDIGGRQSDMLDPDLPVVIDGGQFNAYVVMKIPDADPPVPYAPREVNDVASSSHGIQPLLPRDREITLALSAAPPYIASHAAVYVLDVAGAVRTEQGTNGFACFVERDYDPLVLIPACYDAEGARTVLPVELRKAELLRQHKSRPEVEAAIAQGFSTGQFQPPARISVAYLLSKEGRFATADGRIIGSMPHVRIYAPYAQGADLGVLEKGDETETITRLPTLVHGGSPDAYIVVNIQSRR